MGWKEREDGEEEAELAVLEMRNRGRLYWPEHRGEVGIAPKPWKA